MDTNENTTTPETVDSIGGNPHAEIPPAPPVDFRTDPSAWIAEHIGTPSRTRYGSSAEQSAEHARRAFDSIGALLESWGEHQTNEETEALALLLSLVSSALSWRISEDPRFYAFGPILVPSSPLGVEFVRAARRIAREHIGSARLECVEPDSPLGALLAAIRSHAERQTSGLVETVRNTTNHEQSEQGFRVRFDFAARAFAALPRGETLPPALLSPVLDGYEIEDPLELKESADMCDDGTESFLAHFGIGYEREPGAYECGECGCEHENEEGGGFEHIDDFTLTDSMVEFIDRQGFGDALREFVGGGSESDSLGALLDECDDDELRERFAPPAKPETGERAGIRYDTEVYEFEPDFESIDGAEDLEFGAAMRAGSILSEIAREHASAGVLPPIGGTLRYRPLPYERPNSSRDTIALAWDPSSGFLESALGGGLVFRHDTRRHESTLVIRPDSVARSAHRPMVRLTGEGSALVAQFAACDAGSRAALLLGIAKGSAGI